MTNDIQYNIQVQPVEIPPLTQKAQQKAKITEEYNEFIQAYWDGTNVAEEATDLIQAVITYIDNFIEPFDVAWDRHTDKMESRSWRAREK